MNVGNYSTIRGCTIQLSPDQKRQYWHGLKRSFRVEEVDLKPNRCESCGAPFQETKCAYCGTSYR